MNPIVERIKNQIDLFDDLHTILLFGSATTEHFKDHSDIDLAVASFKPLSLLDTLEIKLRFSKLLGTRDIDLVDLNSTEGLIHREILTKGLVIKEDLHFFLEKLSEMYDYMELYYPLLKDDSKKRIMDFFYK